MEATDEQRAAFGAALSRQLDGLDRAAFRAAVEKVCGESISKPALQQYLAGTSEPSRRKVAAMEKVLKLRSGALSRRLGYVPADTVPARSVLDAIDEDTKLPEKARRILKGSYREFARGEDR